MPYRTDGRGLNLTLMHTLSNWCTSWVLAQESLVRTEAKWHLCEEEC